MKWPEFLTIVRDLPAFPVSVLMAGQRSPADVRRQLARWVASGRVIMLRRGVYRVAAPHALQAPHPFCVANSLRKCSYVSLQSALSYHGMIPEYVPAVTSVTTARPEEVDTPDGRFIFRHVQQRLFFGYVEKEIGPAQTALIATPEKALLDLLYLTPGSDRLAYLEELRVEPPPTLDRTILDRMAVRLGSTKVQRAVKRLVAAWDRQGEEVQL